MAESLMSHPSGGIQMHRGGLRSVPLFDSLSRGERRELEKRVDEIDIDAGDSLVRQGEFAYEFFVIINGKADVVRDGEKIAELGPGDFLGEMGIVEHSVRNASVVASEPVRVVVMSEQAFRGMSLALPQVAERIRTAVEERHREIES